MPSDPDARRAEADDADNRLATWRSKPGQKLAQVVVDTSDRVRSKADSDSAPWVVLAVIAAVGMAVGVALTAVSAEIYDDVVEGDGIAWIDQPSSTRWSSWRSPDLDTWVTHFTDLGLDGDPAVPRASATTGRLVWWWQRWTPVLLMAIACGGGLLMTVVGKTIVGASPTRPGVRGAAVRDLGVVPERAHDEHLDDLRDGRLPGHLPKLHSWSPRSAGRRAAVALGVAMGLSRVYLGHHWLTDVLMAWTLGTAWLIVVIVGAPPYRRRDDLGIDVSAQSSNSTQNSLPSGSAAPR